MNSSQEVGIGCLLLILLLPVILLVRGVVISVLWGWFVVPLGPPDVSIPIGIGIALCYSAISGYEYNDRDPNGIEDVIGRLIASIAFPVWTLFLGYVVHSFVI